MFDGQKIMEQYYNILSENNNAINNADQDETSHCASQLDLHCFSLFSIKKKESYS